MLLRPAGFSLSFDADNAQHFDRLDIMHLLFCRCRLALTQQPELLCAVEERLAELLPGVGFTGALAAAACCGCGLVWQRRAGQERLERMQLAGLAGANILNGGPGLRSLLAGRCALQLPTAQLTMYHSVWLPCHRLAARLQLRTCSTQSATGSCT